VCHKYHGALHLKFLYSIISINILVRCTLYMKAASIPFKKISAFQRKSDFLALIIYVTLCSYASMWFKKYCQRNDFGYFNRQSPIVNCQSAIVNCQSLIGNLQLKMPKAAGSRWKKMPTKKKTQIPHSPLIIHH